MDLYTHVEIPKMPFTFSYQDKIILLGSCFAENMGRRMIENKFRVDVNPFGILYNPASVARAIRMLIRPEHFTPDDLFEQDGVYHSFMHHSCFSATTRDEALGNMNTRLDESSKMLRGISRLVVTFGTAYAYRLKSDGRVVANCHKLPEKMFDREMLSIEDIVKEWKEVMFSLWEHNPKVKILLTVSPIRHWKDGAHGNQLSKATLLLAADRLQQEFPEQVTYFPSYEIMMDELRDYRFYAEDMLHPSSQAIEYIWQRFTESLLSIESKATLNEWKEIVKALNHKPFQPDGEAYKRFIMQTLLKMEQLLSKIPSFDMANEIELLRSKLK